MITLFRNFARSKWAIGLFALLIISFVVVGAQSDVFANFGPKHVVSAGDRSIDQAEFRTEFERVRANMQEQAGRPVTMDDLVAENLHTRFLEEQTEQRGFLAFIFEAGIRPGKDLVIKQIRQIPAFFNSITGQFDQQSYEQALASQNLTPVMLEQDIRDQYTMSHFGAGLFAGARAPRIYGAVLAAQALEKRDGKWFTVTQAMAGAAPAPTDEQLTAFMNENAAQLRRPEFRVASVVLFSNAPGAAAPISDERIRERFEFRKASLSSPETRTFVTLTAPNKAAADRIAAALRAGKTPTEAGAADNIRPSDYTATPQSAVADPAVAAAVFALQSGGVSDAVQGRVGFTVAKVTAIAPGRPVELAEVRDAIIAELREEDAKGEVFARVEKFEAARQNGKSLADAATEVGARMVQLPPFTADGRLPDGQPLNAPPQIFETAKNLAKDGESEVIDAGQGQYFAVRLDDIIPAAMPTLNDVRGVLSQQWTLRENMRRLSAKAEELAGRVRAGEDIAAVAASTNATLVTRTGVQQSQAAMQEIGQGALQGLFGQGKGQVFSGASGQNAFVVGRVDAIHSGAAAEAAPLAEQIRPRLTQELVQAIGQSAITAGAERVKAKYDAEQALQALGVTATAAAPGQTAPAAPAQ